MYFTSWILQVGVVYMHAVCISIRANCNVGHLNYHIDIER